MIESIGGYEWGFTCEDCGEHSGLSGTGFGEHPIVNGEKAVRTRALEPGDTIECPECGNGVTLVALDAEKHRIEGAIELLKRHHYPEVAESLSQAVEDDADQ